MKHIIPIINTNNDFNHVLDVLSRIFKLLHEVFKNVSHLNNN